MVLLWERLVWYNLLLVGPLLAAIKEFIVHPTPTHTHSLFTFEGKAMLPQGRMVQMRVSLSSLHWALSLVIREDTPIPQLREHWDQSVVWTTHFS